MKSAIQDIRENLEVRLSEFIADGEDLTLAHEFVANFVGFDDVLRPAYERLVAFGCSGDPPAGGGWIYMHISRPSSRESVLKLASEFNDVASSTHSLFDLLDVSPLRGSDAGQRVIVGVCDAEAFENA